MADTLNPSNSNNNTTKSNSDKLTDEPVVSENKNSSKPTVANDSPLQDLSTDELVDSIARQESDEVLAVEDQSHLQNPKSPWYHWLKKKPVLISLIVIIILGIALAVPFSRYKLLGLVFKQNYTLQVLDSKTDQPISDVQVSLRGKTQFTNSQGRTTLKVKIGKTQLSLKKSYYATRLVNVLVGLRNHSHTYSLRATGRQVPIMIVNKISGLPIYNARITAAGSAVQTNQKGSAVIVLPASSSNVTATISASGYNNMTATIAVTTNLVASNKFSIIPAGKIYFLSNASGTIDVVSTNLDGSNAQTVLAGTGNEDPNNTQLIMSSDGQYVALLSRRSGSNPSVYLINTSSNKLTTIDDGNANFNLIGWDSHYLIYTVSRNDIQPWQSNQNALKSYDADSGVLRVLDQTTASGTSSADQQSQQFDGVIILANNTILYEVGWNLGYQVFAAANNLEGYVYTVSPNGDSQKTVGTLSVPNGTQTGGIYPTAEQYGPNSVYVTDGFGNYYNYANGQFNNDTSLTSDTFNQLGNTTFFNSSSGMNSLWSYVRDGQNVIYVSSSSSPNGQSVATLNALSPYGWFGNNYILLTKSNSQLYIIPAAGLSNNQTPLKVTNYFANSYAQQ